MCMASAGRLSRSRPLPATDHERLARAVALARSGDRAALSCALTLIENGALVSGEMSAEWQQAALRCHRIGLTGAPGAGKSTLASALIGEFLRRGRSIAVLAVDPSSPITGGAVLGDRVRMSAHADDSRVFIRSMASRGNPGGIAATTGASALLLAACRYDIVLIETVGTGQSEVAIVRAADSIIVAVPPDAGDEVQALKAGVLEIAHVLVVTKSDLPAAERTANELTASLRLRADRDRAVRVVPVCAPKNHGVQALVDALETQRPRGTGKQDGDR